MTLFATPETIDAVERSERQSLPGQGSAHTKRVKGRKKRQRERLRAEVTELRREVTKLKRDRDRVANALRSAKAERDLLRKQVEGSA